MINTIQVLDHGFVTLRNISGPTRRTWLEDGLGMFDADDTDPANAARMSFDQTDNPNNQCRTRQDDLKLSKYLLKNKHTSPFEMIQVWLEMKLPIFVARQFVRHRTVRLNEVSGRYVTLPAEWYIPSQVGGKPQNAKQGQSPNLSVETQQTFKSILDGHCRYGYLQYTEAIAEGVAPEHARMFLSLNHYTHWLWNQDLHNMLHFLSLRDHPHAQIEAQLYAKAIDHLIRQQLPETMSLYDHYVKVQ